MSGAIELPSGWPAPVERVAAFLRAGGAESRLEELAAGAPTAAAAAEALGCALQQIVKTLVFVCDDNPVLALVPGDRRADREKVCAALGAGRGRTARAHEVEAVTGCTPGGVSPLPPPAATPVLVERTILSNPVVWVGGGSDRHLVMIAPLELLRLTHGRPEDLLDLSA